MLIKFCILIYFYIVKTCMQNGDNDLPGISSAGCGHMLITLESHGIFFIKLRI